MSCWSVFPLSSSDGLLVFTSELINKLHESKLLDTLLRCQSKMNYLLIDKLCRLAFTLTKCLALQSFVLNVH